MSLFILHRRCRPIYSFGENQYNHIILLLYYIILLLYLPPQAWTDSAAARALPTCL